MPNLISNYQKRLTVIQLKQAYSIVANAIALSVNKNGPTNVWVFNDAPKDGSKWGNNSKNFYFTYLDEFLQVEQYCGMLSKQLRKGACKNIYTKGDACAYSVVLKNNIGLTIRTDGSETQVELQLDVNGSSGPNRPGRDAFIFWINNKKGLIPVNSDFYGMKPCTRTLTNPNGYKAWVGWGCAYVIMNNGWKMPDDYPWDDL